MSKERRVNYKTMDVLQSNSSFPQTRRNDKFLFYFSNPENADLRTMVTLGTRILNGFTEDHEYVIDYCLKVSFSSPVMTSRTNARTNNKETLRVEETNFIVVFRCNNRHAPLTSNRQWRLDAFKDL